MFGHVGFSNFAIHVLTINSPTESCLRAVSLKLRSIRSWESQNVVIKRVGFLGNVQKQPGFKNLENRKVVVSQVYDVLKKIVD